MRGKLRVFLLLGLAGGFLIIMSYRENGVRTYPTYKTSSMRGFHLTHKDHNKIKWELIAEKATFPDGKKNIILDNLTMNMYHDRQYTLKGGSGIYDIRENSLAINKPIEIAMEDARLITDSLTWSGRSGTITTGDDITFQGPNFLIQGRGLTARINDQHLRILKNVKGVLYHH